MTPLLHECISLQEGTLLDEKFMTLVSQICEHTNLDYVDSIENCPVGDSAFANVSRMFALIERSVIQLTTEAYNSKANSNGPK